MAQGNDSLSESVLTLDELNIEEVKRQIPLMVYLLTICVCGTFGNGIAFHIYRTKFNPSNCVFFVLFLSAADMCSCMFAIPFEIMTLFKQYNFTHALPCQLSVFFNAWPTFCSGWLLFIIATDRYRKVCCPFRRQITLAEARKLCWVTVFFGLLLSWPSPLLYGIYSVEKPEYNLTFTECTVTNEMRETVFPLLNNIMFAVAFVAALGLICIMYTCMALHIKKHEKRIQLVRTASSVCEACYRVQKNRSHSYSTVVYPPNVIEEEGNSDDMFCSTYSTTNPEQDPTSLDAIVEADTPSVMTNSNSLPRQNKNNKQSVDTTASIALPNSNSTGNIIKQTKPKSKPRKAANSVVCCPHVKRRKTQRTSYIMFLIFVAFVLSYLPMLILLMIRTVSDGFVETLSDNERTVYKFFLRSYYLNCTINPFIYGIWDARFRRALKSVLLLTQKKAYNVTESIRRGR